MAFPTRLLQAFLLASTASVLLASPTRVFRRATEPSAFPGDGNAFPNEIQYVNFDMAKQVDKDRVNKIHAAFGEAKDLVQAGLVAINMAPSQGTVDSDDGQGGTVDSDDGQAGPVGSTVEHPAFSRYFDQNEDEEISDVRSVLYQIVQEKDDDPEVAGDFTETFSRVVVDNEDFLDGCSTEFDGKKVQAYTADSDDEERPNWVHFCKEAYDLPLLKDIKCDDLGDAVSTKMESFTATMVHEFTHQSEVGHKSDVEADIIDVRFPPEEDDDEPVYAYGPFWTMKLRQQEDGRTVINSDSYAWMLTNAYFEQTCKKEYADPVDEDADD